jgi:hypothetical protein
VAGRVGGSLRSWRGWVEGRLCGFKGATNHCDSSKSAGSIRMICVICVICGQIGRVGALRLRASAPLRFSWCPPLVSWWSKCLLQFAARPR